MRMLKYVYIEICCINYVRNDKLNRVGCPKIYIYSAQLTLTTTATATKNKKKTEKSKMKKIKHLYLL